jgi:hypothetical protein
VLFDQKLGVSPSAAAFGRAGKIRWRYLPTASMTQGGFWVGSTNHKTGDHAFALQRAVADLFFGHDII